MTLRKAIRHGKEKRRDYRGPKAADPNCQNHGDCFICQGNRTYHDRKRRSAAEAQIAEFAAMGDWREARD